MHTNRDILCGTLSVAVAEWRQEMLRPCFGNKGHEGTFSLEVAEPILESLGWKRLSQGSGLKQTGAYYEWPSCNDVDIALLDAGCPRVFVEFKPSPADCLDDLRETLAKRQEPRRLRYAVGGSFRGDPGFTIYTVATDDNLSPHSRCLFTELSAPETLAALAAPVILEERSREAWLATAARGTRVLPRFRSREMLATMFKVLEEELNLNAPLRLDYEFGNEGPHRPSQAFAHIPDVLPRECGIALCVRSTTNKLQCLFYQGSNRRLRKPRIDFALDHDCTDKAAREFIMGHVVPEIRKWANQVALSAKADGR